MNSHLSLLMLLCILGFIASSQLVLPLKHPEIGKQSEERRHRLNSPIEKTVLRHNMEYLKSQLSHDRMHHLLKFQTFKLKSHGYFFSIPINIAGINYDMTIDTGSSDIFIKGEDSQGVPTTRYRCGSSCMNSRPRMSISYLDGTLNCYETTLPVQFGRFSFNQSVLVAFHAPDNFKHTQGLIGLSYPRLAKNTNQTFISTLIKENIIEQYAFGVNLNFRNSENSFITFGDYDRKFFEGELKMFQLISKDFFITRFTSLTVGDSNPMHISAAILDTGNTCISIPHRFQQEILKAFNTPNNECFFDVQKNIVQFSLLKCSVSNFDDLPILHLQMQGTVYSIEKEFYLQGCTRPTRGVLNSFRTIDSENYYCDTYIESTTIGQKIFLGDGFFNRFYTYFDLEREQVGIAKNREQVALSSVLGTKVSYDAGDWGEFNRCHLFAETELCKGGAVSRGSQEEADSSFLGKIKNFFSNFFG